MGSSPFYPTDVHVRYEGDIDAAKALDGDARNVLFKAQLRMQSDTSRMSITSQTVPGGGLIRVLLSDTLKIITITMPPVAPVTAEEEEPEYEVVPWLPLHGWMDTTDGTNMFMPTPRCARLHSLKPNKKQIVPRLSGFNPLIYACQWTGAMKRAVQAVMGLGIISDPSHEYISGKLPSPLTRFVSVKYQSTYLQTHAIVRAEKHNHWLIEVSQERGILAMPLPLIRSTTFADYRAYVIRRGDHETRRILDEFGGLPSGETFPDNDTDLGAAIAAGKVLQLMSEVDLKAAFYDHHTALNPLHGWAFSETTGEARYVNSCYQNFGVKYTTTEFSQFYFQAGNTIANRDPNGGLQMDYWRLKFNLSKHKHWAPGVTIGTGSVELSLIEECPYSTPFMGYLFVPSVGLEGMGSLGVHSGSTQQPGDFTRPFYPAVFDVFFNGDKVEEVRAKVPPSGESDLGVVAPGFYATSYDFTQIAPVYSLYYTFAVSGALAFPNGIMFTWQWANYWIDPSASGATYGISIWWDPITCVAMPRVCRESYLIEAACSPVPPSPGTATNHDGQGWGYFTTPGLPPDIPAPNVYAGAFIPTRGGAVVVPSSMRNTQGVQTSTPVTGATRYWTYYDYVGFYSPFMGYGTQKPFQAYVAANAFAESPEDAQYIVVSDRVGELDNVATRTNFPPGFSKIRPEKMNWIGWPSNAYRT